MCTLKTVYFPGTAIFTQRQYPLFLLPCSLQLLAAVENVSFFAQQELSDSFIKNDFCQAYTPRPLGENRERFLQLVSDIKLRKDDYAAQLSHLTLASLGDKKQKESKGDILSSLLGKEIVTDEVAEERIWQARLVLQLAELLESEEEELSRNLAILESHEDDLFMTLQGELGDDEENPFADLKDLQKNMTQRSTAGDAKRMAAWKTLHQYATESDKVIITDNEESAETVLEHCAHQKMPQSLFLPAIISWSDDEALDVLTAFKKTHKELLAKMHKAMSLATIDENLAHEWNTVIEKTFAKESHGRREVVLYNLKEGSWEKFLNRTESKNAVSMLYVKA